MLIRLLASPNVSAQQRREPLERSTGKILLSPTFCCSAWFGGIRIADRSAPFGQQGPRGRLARIEFIMDISPLGLAEDVVALPAE